jgi:tetratricopeptide (TPR) repeat protein
MLVHTAEESFQKGLSAFEAGRGREAMAFFEAAIELERRLGGGPPQARYLSLYGLCLGTVGRRRYKGIQFCREAVGLEHYNPDMYCNLGRVLLAAGRRKEAHQAFLRGLRIQSNHREIIQALKGMGIRRRPPLPFLARSNPLNVYLGRMRGSR